MEVEKKRQRMLFDVGSEIYMYNIIRHFAILFFTPQNLIASKNNILYKSDARLTKANTTGVKWAESEGEREKEERKPNLKLFMKLIRKTMTAQNIIHDEEFKTGHDSLLCYTAEIYPPCNVTCTLSSFYRYPIIAMPILFFFFHFFFKLVFCNIKDKFPTLHIVQSVRIIKIRTI